MFFAFSPNRLNSCGRLHSLARCQVIVGLIVLILAALADFLSSNESAIRLVALVECCSVYFIVTGVIGILGAASHRQSLLIAFMVMSIHVIMIFVPAIVIVSSFDIHFHQAECFAQCDWHLLATSLPKDSKCQILCGANVTDNQRSQMSRLGTDFKLDAGIIAASILELIFALGSAILCGRKLGAVCRQTNKDEEVPIMNVSALCFVELVSD
ncbi:unnamed protein product [Enterobius vermicularis]|uniref:Tetraspanin n=1 Tax=Enterobius vermicularis TaxID=51028 RepID=A0A3P6IQX6_ENTVE|nr:unnamed protein product [Enterobius vermicularis]